LQKKSNLPTVPYGETKKHLLDDEETVLINC